MTTGSARAHQARSSAIGQVRLLTFDERVSCRTAVEQVYWEEMDWPATNPSPKPVLDHVLPREMIEARVVDALTETVALAERWSLSVTPEMLQAELNRMAANSQSPETLQRLFNALDGDPVAVVECLVRPILVERLVRERFAQDGEIHAGARAAADAALTGVTDAEQLASLPTAETITWEIGAGETELTGLAAGEATLVDETAFTARLSEVRAAFPTEAGLEIPSDHPSPLQEDAGQFYSLAVVEAAQDRLQVVFASWPKETFEVWWGGNRTGFGIDRFIQPEGDYTLPAISSVDAPSGEEGSWNYMPAMPWMTTTSQSVWTGSVMLVWGGAYSTNGFRYDPALDDWRPITTLNAPHGRHSFTAVWTGTEMIVFGGCNGTHEFCTDGGGGRYNPVTDAWTDIAYGTARRQHTAVWSGSEMLVWGGCTENSSGNQNCNTLIVQGARYNPVNDTWSTMTLTGAPAGTRGARSVWAGNQMIIWNGAGGINGRYFPETDSWQSIATVGGPPGWGPSLVWTGDEMIAWGGCTGDGLCADKHSEGGRYDPATNTWASTPLANAPAPRDYHTAVWTGEEMIVWGGTDGIGNFYNDGGSYDPQSDSWSGISTNGSPSARAGQHTAWTGEEMIVWGGAGPGDERTGGRYNPATDSWLPTSTNDPYRNATYHVSIWDGVQMISWGGEGEQFIDPFYKRARLYDPATDSWNMSSLNEDLDYFWWPSGVWTGTEMIVWGGQYGSNIFDLGARYNPLTDTWTQTSTNGAPEARGNHTAVWTGTEMIVWGGSTWEELFVKTGGRYNPQTDSWVPTPTSGAPSSRYLHQAVWTGSEMIVWGGSTSTGATNSGARFNPATNSWTPMAVAGAPTARVLFGSLWTGNEFLVWGGGVYSSGWTYFNSGGRYDPLSDTWTPTSLSGAPSGRTGFSTTWTGSEMVVWGGCIDPNCLSGAPTGGRYDPGMDSWTGISTEHTIEGREFQTMVWTGAEILVWGGSTDNNAYTHIGGRLFFPIDPNTAPQAVPDAYEVQAGETLAVPAPGLLANDFDADGDSISAVLISGPESGDLALAADGGFTYSPNPGFHGTENFIYKAYDGVAYSQAVTVTIEVQPVVPPVEFLIFMPVILKP